MLPVYLGVNERLQEASRLMLSSWQDASGHTGMPSPPGRGPVPCSLVSDIDEMPPEADSFANSNVDRI